MLLQFGWNSVSNHRVLVFLWVEKPLVFGAEIKKLKINNQRKYIYIYIYIFFFFTSHEQKLTYK